jgi:peptidoglycan/LPS O-acetylase OafA/YrhL
MKSRLLGLDALRGAAALLVLWMHLHLSHHVSIYPPRGHLAVDFFFMLSGYVMARTYEGHMRGGVWFLRKRIRRLWPTVAAGSLFGLALIWRTGGDWPLVAALNLLLIPALFGAAAFPLNTPIWSIFFELLANAVHGGWLHKWRNSHLTVLAATAGLASLALAVRFHSYSLGSNTGDFIGGFPRVLFAYFYGVLLWRIWRDQPPLRVPPAVLVPIAIFLFTPREPISDFLFVALACPTLIAIGIVASPGRWAAVAGALSFPLYAVHRPILGIVAALGIGWQAGAAGSILAAAALLMISEQSRRSLVFVKATSAA